MQIAHLWVPSMSLCTLPFWKLTQKAKNYIYIKLQKTAQVLQSDDTTESPTLSRILQTLGQSTKPAVKPSSQLLPQGLTTLPSPRFIWFQTVWQFLSLSHGRHSTQLSTPFSGSPKFCLFPNFLPVFVCFCECVCVGGRLRWGVWSWVCLVWGKVERDPRWKMAARNNIQMKKMLSPETLL